MKKVITAIIILVISAQAVFASGSVETATDDTQRLSVFVSILPQSYFAERIGGERVRVDVVVPPGKNPATYEPSPSQVAALSGADVLFITGVPFENVFLPKLSSSLKNLLIVDSAEGIKKRNLGEHHHDEDGEHEEDEHEADEHDSAPDPHVWLSPVLAKTQAENIYRTLVRLDPAGREVYDKGLAELKADLDRLHSELKAMLEPYHGETLFIYHPTLGYFADEYGLEQAAIELGGKQPSAAALAEVIEHAKHEGVKIIFVQPEFSKESAAVVADAIDGSVVGLNPLDPDYLDNLRDIGRKIVESYE